VVKHGRASTPTAIVATALVLVGCGRGGPSDAAEPVGVDVVDGFVVEVIVDDLDGPTQFALLPDGDLVVAELNGGERDGTGRIVRVSGADPGDRTVLLDGLATPTGVAVESGLLWVMEQRRLTVGPLADPSERTVVADELAFNGRSEGTLTAVDGGGVLFDTSGRRDGDALAAGSGTLWFQASPDAARVEVATGFKHAYAHVVDDDGQLWSTEMADGTVDGRVPPDELVRVRRGDDFGYPRCVGDGVPAVEFGATADECDGTPPSHALFEPGATPTSVAVAPWDRDQLLVALWNRGRVVAVPRSPTGRPHRGIDVVVGLDSPQHLVGDAERLLVGDFSAGRILAVRGDDSR
jgi:glucose/arabinose dehydrogenase